MAITSFRGADSRTITTYEVEPGGKIIASDRNYCVEKLKANRCPRVENNQIYIQGFDGREYYEYECTQEIINDLQRYSWFDFTDTPELAFLGRKGTVLYSTSL